MKARNAYRLHHQKDSRVPSRLDPLRYDSIEVVEVATGETVLLWDLPAPDAKRRLKEVREDLNRLDEQVFIGRWSARA